MMHKKERFSFNRLSSMTQNLSLGSSSEFGELSSIVDSAYSSPSSSVSQMMFSSNSAAAASLTNILCRLCNNLYSSPRVLPCLHSFCSACLDAYIRDSEAARCPSCHTDFVIPQDGGVTSLPPDYGLTSIMKSYPANYPVCYACSKSTATAVAKCINCDSVMCQSCLGGHNFVECNEWSRISDKDRDVGIADSSSNAPPTTECLVHTGCEVNQYCITCEVPICEECLTSDHPLSEGHRCELLSDISDSLQVSMSKMLSEWRSRLVDISNAVQFSDQSLVRLYNQFKEAERKIQETYEDFITILIKHREEQMNHLESTYLSLHRRLTDMNRTSKESLERLAHVTEFCSRLMKYATVPQRLLFKGHLESRSKHFSAVSAQRIVCGVQFISNPKTIFDGIINTFGYVAAQFEVNGFPQITHSPSLHNGHHSAKTYDSLNKLAEQLLLMNLEPSNSLCFFPEKKCNQRLLAVDHNPSYHVDNMPSPKLNLPIKSIVPRQQISYVWKFGAFGKMEGQFSEPNGVALNRDDDIIIADTNNNRVQLFNKTGRYKFHFGCSPNSEGQLLFPNRVAITPGGDIVVTERAPTHQIQIYNQYGQFVRKFGSDILQFPRAVAVDKNNFIIVVECKIMRVVIFDQYGKLMHKFHCNHNLQFPNSVAVHNNEIFISDNRSHCVMVYDYEGNLLRHIGHEGLTNYPIGVLVTLDGHVLIADNHNNFNLTVFTTDGTLVSAYESKVKHSQCYDVSISQSGVLALTCKDYHVYLYHYPSAVSGSVNYFPASSSAAPSLPSSQPNSTL